VARFALWAEWFFAVAVQQRSRRNIRKTALEAWNAYAVAEGLISEPYLRRSDMEAHVRTVEGDAAADGLGEPEHAVAFVLSLADRLHRTRLPELRPLAEPLLFETIIAPLGMRRLFAVLPRADTPLPPEVFERPGVFPCTPQLLNLHMNFKSAFLSWAVPQQLRDLGMTLPGVGQFLRHSRAFNDDRFLRHPGFAMRHHPGPWVVTSCIRHALASAERGEVPKPITPEQLEAMMTGISSMEDYYRTRYADLRREVESVRESLEARLSWPLGQRSG
jgi:hypothetical protein